MTTANVQFAIDTLDLRFHRVEGNDQFASDLRVGSARNQETQDTLLSRAERFKHVITARWYRRRLERGKVTQQRT